MVLLERENFLASLHRYADDALRGSGRFVLIGGEAGIGKTALLDAFCEQRPDLRWLHGACDGSFTPQPLGPLHDIAAATGGELLAHCRDGVDRWALFSAFLTELERGPCAVVVEDAHWADDATLDWLRWVCRRLAKRQVLFVVTYRDDEAGALRPVLGDMATHAAVRRMALPALSAEAVQRLTGRDDVRALYRMTGGIPFYVNELSQAGSEDVPPTVTDLLAARTRRLSESARAVVDALAVLGSPADASTVVAVARTPPATLDDAVAAGVVVTTGAVYRFRHDILRLAADRGVTGVRRAEMHARALAALAVRPTTDDAALAWHAEQAGDRAAALHHAVAAGAEAFRLRAHRQAVEQYRRAVWAAKDAPAEELAELHERLATAYGLVDRWDDALGEWRSTVALRRELGAAEPLSRALRSLARCQWRLCRNDKSGVTAREAFELMRDAPDSPERAWAFSSWAALSTVAPPSGLDAANLCHAAIAIARSVGEAEAEAYALDTLGLLQLEAGDEAGWESQEGALRLSVERGLPEQAARAYANLYQASVDRCRIERYEHLYDEGMSYIQDNDMPVYLYCLRASRVTGLVRRGELTAAVRLADSLAGTPMSPVNRLHVSVALAAALVRLGDPRAGVVLADTMRLAERSGETEWLLLLAAVRATAAWQRGGPVEDDVVAVYDRHGDENVWLAAELATWLARCGIAVRAPRTPPEPFAAELRGDQRAAAAWWRHAGCPFEEAAALVTLGDVAATDDALRTFTALGAEPAAGLARARLRAAGVASVPRGPRAATRAHPDGLTTRQAEVLELLRRGLSNAAIARQLVISERTTEHHVAAVLAKLNVSSRLQLATLPTAAG